MDQTVINVIAVVVTVGLLVCFVGVLRHDYRRTGRCRECGASVAPQDLECAEHWGDRQI